MGKQLCFACFIQRTATERAFCLPPTVFFSGARTRRCVCYLLLPRCRSSPLQNRLYVSFEQRQTEQTISLMFLPNEDR